jgi:SAM-dependent methyltransferase
MQTNNSTAKYVHEPDAHNLISPNAIVPFIMKSLHPVSVVDVGCGIGTFLHVFKKHGVNEVLGIDGKWVNKAQLHIDVNEFMECDLEKPIKINKTFDLVVCLEVAEHLAPSSADIIVDSLTSLGKVIAFGAATVHQGGQNHINEQPFSYWKEKFEARGYKVIDFFRPVFWNQEEIQWWYKQNMFLIVHNSINSQAFEGKSALTEDHLLIHPHLYYERIQEYQNRVEEIRRLREGEAGNFNYYLKLLYKSFFKRNRR